MKRGNKGWTLIELVMVIAVIGALAWVGTAALLSGVDNWGFFTQRKQMFMDARMALDRMSREIRRLKNPESINTATALNFQFIDNDDRTLGFYIYSGAVRRTENGAASDLLSDVTSFGFTYYDAAGGVIANPQTAPSSTDIRKIKISVTVSGAAGQSVNLETVVWPRSLK